MVRLRRIGWRRGLIGLALMGPLVAVGGFGLGIAPSTFRTLLASRDRRPKVETRPVHRRDLNVVLTASGTVASSNQTVISCELEKLAVNVRGNGYAAGGSAVVTSLLPEGTPVTAGQVICTLDSSDYEELVRQQEMNLLRARADHDQAVLNLDIARSAVVEYRDGLMAQTLKEMRGQIALAESDWERARDRLQWSRRMLEKGYLAKGQVASEEFGLRRIALSLAQSRTSLLLFERFTAPIALRRLQGGVLSAETVLNFQQARLRRTEDRLKNFQKQVTLCTIRAPHDGFLIYASEPRRNIRIEEGMSVYQRQRLFILPDLSKMEVSALIHESVVDEVKPGMIARVSIEGLPSRRLEGHLTKVSQLPELNQFNDVKYFVGAVKLDAIPSGLRPGMSAEVEIQTVRRHDVLAIPAESLAVEGGRDVCYVAFEDHIERRPITLGQSTRDLLEVTSGLEEGDEVVLDPSALDSGPVALAKPPLEGVAPEHPAPTLTQ